MIYMIQTLPIGKKYTFGNGFVREGNYSHIIFLTYGIRFFWSFLAAFSSSLFGHNLFWYARGDLTCV